MVLVMWMLTTVMMAMEVMIMVMLMMVHIHNIFIRIIHFIFIHLRHLKVIRKKARRINPMMVTRFALAASPVF